MKGQVSFCLSALILDTHLSHRTGLMNQLDRPRLLSKRGRILSVYWVGLKAMEGEIVTERQPFWMTVIPCLLKELGH